eukprot:scaffold83982_cov72-Phaeocystis_antarctica.AAC.2
MIAAAAAAAAAAAETVASCYCRWRLGVSRYISSVACSSLSPLTWRDATGSAVLKCLTLPGWFRNCLLPPPPTEPREPCPLAPWSLAVARQMPQLSSTRTTGGSSSTQCAPGKSPPASVHSCLSALKLAGASAHAPPAGTPPPYSTRPPAHSLTVPRPLQAYINSKISTAKGRKMPIAHSCEFPTVFEIVEVLKHLGYENPLIEVRPAQRCVCLHASALVGCMVVARCLSRHCRTVRIPDPAARRTRRIHAATSRSGAACAWSSRTRSQATPPSRTSSTESSCS